MTGRETERHVASDGSIAGWRDLRLGAAGRESPERTLLLHGFTGTSEDWLEAWPERHPALALDLPGHGRSSDPIGGFDHTLHDLLAALPASIDQVVGYSLGARLALGLLRLAPLRFGKVVIISAHPGLSDPAAREARRKSDARWIRLLTEHGLRAFVDAWERQPLFASQSGCAPALLEAQRRRRLRQRAEGLARSLACHGLAEMPDMRSGISRFGGELRWVAGTNDEKFTAFAEQVVAMRPATRFYRLQNVGHNPLLEAPERLHALLGVIF